MNKIVPSTLYIQDKEPAIALVETNQQGHRWRIIYVLRADKLAEYREDMGDEKKWKGIKPFHIPSLCPDGTLEHTVKELLHIADAIRGQTKIDEKDFLEIEHYNKT